MRVLKPLILARRRQMSAGPARRDASHPFVLALPVETTDAFDMRDEPRAFTDTAVLPHPVPRVAAE
ncbi:MAG TPA: hypothetical protein VGN96_13325 [Roseococcus sp.]|jgi:hypothetical protein|nr:hypothetical protein [Roseococcus sp.]